MLAIGPPGRGALLSRAGTMPAARRAASLTIAIDTMMRGTDFLQGRAAALERRGASSVARHAMVLANALRELDCFLLVLLDELAAQARLPEDDMRAVRRRRSAAGKLSACPALFGGRDNDERLLRNLAAQKRSLLALFRGRRPAVGERPVEPILPTVDLSGISAFYADLAARIIGNASGELQAQRAA